MININTGQNVAILAEREIDRLIARQPARDGDGKTNKPPRPPAYVKVKRAQSKRKPKQLRLAIEKWNNMERIAT